MNAPRCPSCNGLLKHEPADILGPERVHCFLCGWELVRATPPKKREETTAKHELDWVTQALSIKTLITKSACKERRTAMTTNNALSDLNDHLFGQLARLSSNQIKGEQLKEEIERTRAMSGLAKEMIENAKLALEVQRTLGGKATGMLQVESK